MKNNALDLLKHAFDLCVKYINSHDAIGIKFAYMNSEIMYLGFREYRRWYNLNRSLTELQCLEHWLLGKRIKNVMYYHMPLNAFLTDIKAWSTNNDIAKVVDPLINALSTSSSVEELIIKLELLIS
jgi:hypothetical protein